MSYAAVDQIVRDWAGENVKTLFTESAGQEARFCYLSSPQGECYQISIEAPEHEGVRVHIFGIETLDDVEVHLEWFVPVARLRDALDTAKQTIVECLWARTPLRSE